MKTLLSLAACLVAAAAFSQKATAPVRPTPPELALAPVPPRAVAVAVDDDGIAVDVDRVKRDVERASAQVRAAGAAFNGFGGGFGGDFFIHGGRLGRTLIVPTAELDTKAVAGLEEDLLVMARILEKALERKDDDDGPKAMGIDVFSMGGSSGVRNLYLDGYGAVFLLKVKFPLSPPPAKSEESKTKEPTNSVWEDTKRQLFGPRPEGVLEKTWQSIYTPHMEEYDASKVDKLKDALVEALKNASNIRHLKPAERVTIVVTSAAASGDTVKRVVSEHRGTSNKAQTQLVPMTYVRGDDKLKGDGTLQSMLTIHAKKSDIDAFAKGNLSLEEFRKKVTMLVY